MRKTSLISTCFPRRATRRRAGSILILVVAVLVLLALMGTAFMSTARLDRLASGPLNAATTDEVIEQLVPTVSDMARQTILDDIAALAQGYRPPPVVGNAYDHWDSYLTNYRDDPGTTTVVEKNDAWLSARIPEIVGAGANQRPSWRAISRPLNQPATGGEIQFETPYIDPATAFPATTTPPWLAGYTGGTWTFDPEITRLAPTDLTVTYPPTHPDPGLAGKTRVFPAFNITDLAGVLAPDANGRAYKILAGDADGDGIADSGLVYMTTVDGVRYYYAVRIVDENSAINVNTAWSMMGDFGPGNTAAPDVTPSNWVTPGSVGLRELLESLNSGGPEMNIVNAYRMNVAGAIAAPTAPVGDPTPATPSANPRTDFTYTTQMQALYEALGRRLDYPGWRVPGTSPTPEFPDPNRYQAAALDRHLDLSYHFAYTNPETDHAAAGGVDTLERRLHNQGAMDLIYRSSVNWAQNAVNEFRYLPADKWQYWSEWSFDFDPARRQANWGVLLGADAGSGTPPTPVNVRSLLTTYNGVSNSIIKHSAQDADVPHPAMLPYDTKGRWELGQSNTTGYKIGDIVIHTFVPVGAPPPGVQVGHPAPLGFPVGVTHAFYCLQNYTGAGEPQMDAAMNTWAPLVGRGYWLPTPFNGVPYTKGNLVVFDNTATGGFERDLYVCIANGAGGNQPNTDATHWKKLDAGPVPPKVSLNTAPFSELFRGFWNVMKSDLATEDSPFDTLTGSIISGGGFGTNVQADLRGGNFPPTFNNPYVGNRFYDYYAVDATTGNPAPYTPNPNAFPDGPGEHPQRMFRSPIRAVPNLNPGFEAASPRLPADQVVLLRAAIAAVNAEDLRDADSNITAREIMLEAIAPDAGDQPARTPVSCVVYGNEPQPFITEVYINTDTDLPGSIGTNENGYVAIELYNPYPVPIPMTNWVIAAVNRRAGAVGTAAHRAMTVLADFAVLGDAVDTYPATVVAPLTIQPYSYMILENHPSLPGSTVVPTTIGYAANRTGSSGIISTTAVDAGPIMLPPPGSPNVQTVYVPGLGDNGGTLGQRTVCDYEMVILRPRNTDPAISAIGVYPSGVPFDDTVSNPGGIEGRLRDMVPVDSFDFTGLLLGAAGGAQAQDWHYVRRSNKEFGGMFHFVYPGRYDGGVAAGFPRQSGTQTSAAWNNGDTTANDPWNPTFGGTPPGHPYLTQSALGPSMSFTGRFDEATNTYTQYTVAKPEYNGAVLGDGSSNIYSSTGPNQPSRPLQLSYYNFAQVGTVNVSNVGHNPVLGPGGNAFPFGGFMRAGDVMHVPFIGAYRILDPIGPSGTPVLLEINSITMDAAMAEDTSTLNDGAVATTGAYNEYIEQIGRFGAPWTTTMAGGAGFSYSWASDLLDQFTAIQNLHDDFVPNVDPARYPSTPASVKPTPVANMPGARPNTLADRDAPVQGLININTAPAAVLRTLPLVINTDGTTNVPQSVALADAIVRYRDVNDPEKAGAPHGPFKSLFELNAVIDSGSNGFYNMMGQVTINAFPGSSPNDSQGDFTPENNSILGTMTTDDDEVQMDYEERYLNVMRLSNLLTTRSDVFKAYVLVQGWKNTGTEHPQLVAERRAAYIIDRSKTASDNTTLNVLTVPSR